MEISSFFVSKYYNFTFEIMALNEFIMNQHHGPLVENNGILGGQKKSVLINSVLPL